MDTLLLDQTAWDLVLDSNGNIAIASDPYAIAQDCQSAIRTFLGECYYDTTIGIPYKEQILGKRPPLAFFIAQLEQACLLVPEVTKAQCTITAFANRKITGYILITSSDGNQQTIFF